MPAIPAIIAGGASLASAFIGKSAVGKAENIQSEAGLKAANLVADSAQTAKNDLFHQTDIANGTLSDVYGYQQNVLNPYMAAGNQGINSLAAAFAPGGDLTKQFNFTPGDLTKEPGYQFQLNEGLKAIQNSAAAGGAGGSGGTYKSLVGFGEGLAETTYQKAFDRALTTFQTNRNNTLGGLGLLANYGQNANALAVRAAGDYGHEVSTNERFLGGTLAEVGTRGARDTADILTGRANAQAAGTVGQANALTGGIKGAAEAAISGWDAYKAKPKVAKAPSSGSWSAPLTTLN